MYKRLSELLQAIPSGVLNVTGDAAITAPVVESDAELQPGGLFVARRGLSVDGHDFIQRAIDRGAAAIVGERPMPGLTVPYAQVENAREAVGYLAAAFHDFPSRKLVVIGVTGTDGKTTTSTLIHSILQAATGNKAGLISTVAAVIGDQSIDTGLHVTTPGAPQIQALLARMVESGFTHAVLEMTSHGLAQGRLNGVDIDIAVLTNVTHEHLDYHGSFEAYRAAKARMFQMLGASYRTPEQPKISVINADDPSASYFASIPADRVVTYGLDDRAEFQAVNIQIEARATTFDVLDRLAADGSGQPQHRRFVTPLVGEFNLRNSLAAVVTALQMPIATGHVRAGLAAVRPIPGRLERIDEGQPFIGIVDFAHTPNALKNALEAVRPLVGEGGRLIAVFGSAGLRDREKRRLMAEISTKLADISIFTAEDPRTESLDAILQTMADAALAAGGREGATFIRVPDRGEALFRACQMAREGDVVIACGKGHEQSMAFDTVEYPWDDRDALRAALRGQPLKTLPTARTQ